MKKRTLFLSDYVVNQYPIEEYKDIIIIALDLADNFLILLNKSEGLTDILKRNINFAPKIESIYLKDINDKKTMQDFIDALTIAFSSLNEAEQRIFNASFIEKLSDIQIIGKYKTHSNYIRVVRRSAIIRFCLKSGLCNLICSL